AGSGRRVWPPGLAAGSGRRVWPPGLAVCAQPVPGVHRAATGTGAHPQSASNVEDFPFVEDQPP
ncbi:MAG TPA: hypothetical protein VFB06_27425, partial [Streptosporangiaceae bacterium]|nr:hypothetical protein [Streptosporangiaceae bacterium]